MAHPASPAYKSKVRYRRKTGHRQSLTRLRITDILLDGASSFRAIEADSLPLGEAATSGASEPVDTEPRASSTDEAVPASVQGPETTDTQA